MLRGMIVALLLLLPAAAAGQDNPPPDVDPKAVNEALDKAVAWICQKYDTNNISDQKYVELVLLSLVHAGLRPDHPIFSHNLNKLLGRNLNETYNVGLRALLLEKVNRKFYQPALFEIASYFVDSQTEPGQWTYHGRARKPAPSAYVPYVTPSKKKALPGSTRTADEGPPPGKDIKVPPAAKLAKSNEGDNSNAQYAVLGLFAASRAAVVVPKETWERAEKWFESKQNADGGWGYNSAALKGNGGGALGIVSDASSGSMTTAGLTALIVSKFYLGKDWKAAPSVSKGLDWLGKNFSVTDNPKGHAIWHYYYLYGLERVGTVSGLKEFGGHNWYKEGAEYLLKAQQKDGSWKSTAPGLANDSDDVIDTCFAILFLRRATPELKKPKDIATGDMKRP